MATFSELREECYRWATIDSDSDADADKEIERSYRKDSHEIDELNARLATLQRQLQRGGRRKRRKTYHREAHMRIFRDYFGHKAVVDENGVTTKRKARFHETLFARRFRMSSNQFQTIHDDITDPEIGSRFFQRAPDASDRIGASNMQKLVAAIRQLAYGTCSDHVHEYTGVAQKTAAKALEKLCRWVIRTYGDEFLNSWGEAEIKAEMEVNAKRGFLE